jgi:uncharacterized protein (TIGR02466 family)
MRKVVGLFPTPLMKMDGLLDAEQVEPLRNSALEWRKETNVRTRLLSHTRMIAPQSDKAFAQISRIVNPEVVEFGALMFGERLRWIVKEMWLNVLQPGGSQFMHTHANSFISGVVYLTRPHPSTNTVFTKSMGGTEFLFKHDTPDSELNPSNSDKWICPEINAGDLVMFPSYLLHGVPPNEGEQRITIAFNAVPEHLKSWDYEIRFA